jgi:cyclopropane-fatty-acyl-phospholipid synthase
MIWETSFYALFLDETMTYSCGIFAGADSTLEDAAIAKYDRICQKLGLKPGDEVLEIGSGWGGFALHAAGRYGCRVTTTTISRAQYDLARAASTPPA